MSIFSDWPKQKIIGNKHTRWTAYYKNYTYLTTDVNLVEMRVSFEAPDITISTPRGLKDRQIYKKSFHWDIWDYSALGTVIPGGATKFEAIFRKCLKERNIIISYTNNWYLMIFELIL